MVYIAVASHQINLMSLLSGTNVMIYNLKLMDNGLPELDVTKDDHDIYMADPHAGEVYDIHEK